MSFAPNYSPTVGFATEESNSVAGRSTVRTVAVDNELANISSSINGLNTNLKKLQRDDGKPADFLIEPYALSEQTRALITAGGNPRGAWLPATDYKLKDCVQYSSVAYICIADHTSVSVFDANLWMAISGDGSAAVSATAAANSATAAATSATNAANSATAAATSATAASGSATAAANSATAAANSATAAANSATAAAANKTATDANVTASANNATAASNSAAAAAAAASASVLSMKYSSFVTNLMLDSTHDGKHLGTSTDALTLTLPQISTVRDGYQIAFSLNAAISTGLTIQRGGTDQIVIGNFTCNSLKLTKFGDSLVLVASTTTNRWFVLHDGIDGPYFQASFNSTQAAPTLGVYTKLGYGNEISDSHGCYDPSIYRFTPSIPGWYQVTAAAWMVATAAKRCGISIYKNGSAYMQGNRAYMSNDGKVDVNCLVYLNGSGDYIEAYVVQADTASGITDVDGGVSATMPNFTARRIK